MDEPKILTWLSLQYGRRFTALSLVADNWNRTYRAEDGEETFFLRFYGPVGRSPVQLLAEASLLTSFPECELVDVSRPISTAEGTYFLKAPCADATRTACLFESAEGQSINSNPAHMERFGASIASLHVAMPKQVEGEIRNLRPVDVVGEIIEALRGSLGTAREISGSAELATIIERQYLPALRCLALTDLPQGLCHV